MALEMASPSKSPIVDLDIEAQTNFITDTPSRPPIISPISAVIVNPLPTRNIDIPHLPRGADLQPQATNADENHNENAAAQQTGLQRGMYFPFRKVGISFAF
jgi:hypothetical protein